MARQGGETMTTRQPLRYLSLFSGVGGFDLGFDRAGMVCAGQVEYDEKARAVLARHWPDVKRMNDVREVQGDEFGTIDVIAGGFPCQDVSVAGRRAGLAGERSGLWFEFHRIIDRVKPGWVVIENVPGLLSSHGGRDFAVILRGLVECGYGVAWRVLDAQYFGVPQRRRRVFIVGHLGDGRAAEVLFEREGGGGDIAEGRSKGAGTAWEITERTRNTGRNLEYQPDVMYSLTNPGKGGRTQSRMVAFGGNNTSGPIHVATTQMAHGGTGRHDFGSETFVVTATLNSGGNNGGFRTEPGEHLVAVPLRAEGHDASEEGRGQGVPMVMAWNGDTTPKFSDGPMLTLGAEQGGEGIGIISASGVRRLTPVECERLQGFPDGHTAGQSDSARYRQMGNAVAVPVVEWLGRRIVEAEG